MTAGLLEKEAEIREKNILKRNYIYSTIDGSLFALAMGMVPLNTVILYFISGYVSQKWLIGLLSFINVLLTFSPQILASKKIERLKYLKPFMLITSVMIRILWLILGLTVILFAKNNKSLFIILFYIIYSLIGLASAFSNISWLNFIVKIIPAHVRGRFLGIRSSIAGVFESTGALLMGLIIKILPYPFNYGILFLTVSALTFISFWVLSLSKEEKSQEYARNNDYQSVISRIGYVLKNDMNFTKYLITVALIAGLGKMAFAFQIIFAKDKLGINEVQLSISSFIFLASQSLGYLLWGIIGDKRGFKLTLEISAIIFLPAILFTYMMSSIFIFYLSMCLFGLAQSARNCNENNLAIVLCKNPTDQPLYIGLRNLLMGPFFAMTPVLAGLILDFMGYDILFIVSTIFVLSGLYVMRFHVIEK
ncbi:MAG: MFS transporter [Bacillota bacterium]|nr:MFS transporter [Bacillota bacterium]